MLLGGQLPWTVSSLLALGWIPCYVAIVNASDPVITRRERRTITKRVPELALGGPDSVYLLAVKILQHGVSGR